VALIGWVDTDEILDYWSDAPDYVPGGVLATLLDTAHELLAGYAGATLIDPAPARYTFAQILLTQHLWARKQAGDGNGFGAEGFTMSTYPLVLEARGLMRPKTSPFAGLL
jgi:hypothetical protein